MGAPCWNRAGERKTCWTKAAGENLYGNCFDAPGLDQSCWLAIRRSLAVAVRGTIECWVLDWGSTQQATATAGTTGLCKRETAWSDTLGPSPWSALPDVVVRRGAGETTSRAVAPHGRARRRSWRQRFADQHLAAAAGTAVNLHTGKVAEAILPSARQWHLWWR